MRHEHKPGALHAAHVQDAFVRLLQNQLPREIFAELDSVPMERPSIEKWAALHGINAPCVVEAFAFYCNGGWTKHGACNLAGGSGPHIPREWLVLVAQMNARPVDPRGLKGYYADDYVTTGAFRGVDVPGVPLQVIEQACDRHLGPVAVDPSLESWDDFLERARSHWHARVREARKFGLRPAGKESEWRNLDRDLQWLFRYQVNLETVEQIAPKAPEDAIEPGDSIEGVKKAIDRVSRAVGLKRPKGRRRRLQRPLK